MDHRPDRSRFLALRSATLERVPGYRAGPRAATQLAALWARGEALGLTHRHAAEAQLVYFRDPEPWFGAPTTLALVDRDPRSTRGLAALLDAVRSASPDLDETTWMEVDASDLALVEGLVALGFGIDSIQQVGDARVALERVRARPGKAPPSEDGRFVRARPADLGGILELHRAAFTAHPEHCFFGAHPGHLRRMQADLERALRSPAPLQWVVREGGRVLAHVEADLTPDHPQWGAVSGMALVLDPALQGQGLARAAYRVALTAAVAAGARTLKGGTSQPAVMALGAEMQRPWHAFGLRREVAFPPEHFLRFHPLRRRAAP